MAELSAEQLAELKLALQAQRAALTEEIRKELLQSDQEHYGELATQVHDKGDESVADLLSDIDLATIDHHIRELREVEAALQRLAMGSYGTCEECSADIGYARLKAYPMAQRCVDCQSRFEQSHVGTGGASL